jgi:hypothetical protein
VPLETDSCIYRRGDIIAVIYVDDILAAPTIEQCNIFYDELKQHVAAEHKGTIKRFLDIDIIRNWEHALNQGAYIDRLVA